MSISFRDGKIFLLDGDFVEWEAIPTNVLMTAPDPRGVSLTFRLTDHVLMLRKSPNQPYKKEETH